MISKDDPRFVAVLDMADPDFGEKLVEALGLKRGDELEIVTPQFKRTDGKAITYIPKTETEYDAIRLLDRRGREALGMGYWGQVQEDAPDAKELWLFPHEWYSSIPAGLELVNICGGIEKFTPGETNDDMRFGLLAFGFVYERSDALPIHRDVPASLRSQAG